MIEFSDEQLQDLINNANLVSASELARETGDERSLRSIQRDIKARGLCLNSKYATDQEVLGAVRESVGKLGPVYGRKTATGFLRSQGLNIGEGRVGAALKMVAPESHTRRQQGISRQLNPLSYHAPYFGYNCHIDQNEKLVDYGVVICGLVDGASNFLLGFNVMAHKNPIEIYEQLFLPVISEFGLFDCLIADCGKEFALIQYVQQKLSYYRVSPSGEISQRPAIKQLRSTENNRIERIWVMVNDRCTYPLKNLLSSLQENGSIDMGDELTRFAVSRVSQGVVTVLLGRLRESWNHHSIPQHGKPIAKLVTTQTYQCPIPTTEEAIDAFMSEGRHLTAPWSFGVDPVPETLREQRDQTFIRSLRDSSYESLSDSVLLDDPTELLHAISSFARISINFSA